MNRNCTVSMRQNVYVVLFGQYVSCVSTAGEVFAGGNDRCVLLETQSLLERGLRWTHLFMSSCNGGEEDPVAMMYGELCYALTRVKVKLTATIPPPGKS